MKKWIALGLVVLALAVVALPVIAKDNGAQLAELEDLYKQLAAIREKIVNLRVDMGQITPEQAEVMKERAAERHEWLKEHNFECPAPGAEGLKRGPMGMMGRAQKGAGADGQNAGAGAGAGHCGGGMMMQRRWAPPETAAETPAE